MNILKHLEALRRASSQLVKINDKIHGYEGPYLQVVRAVFFGNHSAAAISRYSGVPYGSLFYVVHNPRGNGRKVEEEQKLIAKAGHNNYQLTASGTALIDDIILLGFESMRSANRETIKVTSKGSLLGLISKTESPSDRDILKHIFKTPALAAKAIYIGIEKSLQAVTEPLERAQQTKRYSTNAKKEQLELKRKNPELIPLFDHIATNPNCFDVLSDFHRGVEQEKQAKSNVAMLTKQVQAARKVFTEVVTKDRELYEELRKVAIKTQE